MTLSFSRLALIAAVVGLKAVLAGAYDNSRFDNVSPGLQRVIIYLHHEVLLMVAYERIYRWQCENIVCLHPRRHITDSATDIGVRTPTALQTAPTPLITRSHLHSTARYVHIKVQCPEYLCTHVATFDIRQDDAIDVFPLAFLNVFFGPGGEPSLNLANVGTQASLSPF